MRVAYADAAGIRTRFLTAGAGDALFLLHGVGASADSFAQNVRTLGERFRVVAPDLIGHGFSAGGLKSAPAPHVQMAAQVLALADRLDIAAFAPAPPTARSSPRRWPSRRRSACAGSSSSAAARCSTRRRRR